MDATLAAVRWDEEYRRGRYTGEPPLPFVEEIITTLATHNLSRNPIGLYIGCGNGRNYIPLVDRGLDLYGLDVSAEAIVHLAGQRPLQRQKLFCGDFLEFQSDHLFDYLVALQVFQHGRDSDIANYFYKTAALLKPGGLFFLRVNAISTEIYHQHTIVEKNDWGGFTIEYLAGPKQGLSVHFYSRSELLALARDKFVLVTEPREEIILRSPPQSGSWAQWEGVWQKK